jgi:TPR repeat protein
MHKSFLYFLVYLVLSVSAIAAPPKEALLIANGKYSHFAGLAHPTPDAAKLSAALEQLGFRVRVVRDGNREQMLDAIAEFERGLRNTGAIAFFHYGGHGVQVDGKNYLLPADADIPDERRVATRAVALDEVMTAMDAAAARASIIVIDACRDNPLPAGSGRNLARGLSVVGMKPKNSIVIYAAEAGSKALDGLFTPILASSLQQKGRSINQIMMGVRSEVHAKSSGQQTPGEYNQLFEELFLGESVGDDLSAEKVFAAKPTPTPHPAIMPAVKEKNLLADLRESAQQGDANAQFTLGECYKYGEGVAKDAVEAVKWFRKAAEQGDAKAEFNLGLCYYTGKGVAKDAVEGVKWFRRAAEQGNADAQTFLGICYDDYDDSEGVAKDAVEAVKWYRRAAEQGATTAQLNLGSCYSTGRGVTKDVVEAVKWFRRAAEQGDAKAQLNLGLFYYTGEGLAKDAVEAYAFFNLASVTNEVALKSRELLAKEMTREQVAAAQKRTKELQRELEGN